MSFMIVELIQYFFMQMVLNNVFQMMKLFSTSKFFAYREFVSSREHFKIHVDDKCHDPMLSKSHLSFTKNTTIDDVTLRREDVELLMANIGLFYHDPDSEKLPQMLNSNNLLNIFEQEQPRLDEVKEAFEVFDENKDGFIDSSELQRVLCALGLNERAEIEDCKKMIRAFDLNADGRLDFNEFVKCMENTYC